MFPSCGQNFEVQKSLHYTKKKPKTQYFSLQKLITGISASIYLPAWPIASRIAACRAVCSGRSLALFARFLEEAFGRSISAPTRPCFLGLALFDIEERFRLPDCSKLLCFAQATFCWRFSGILANSQRSAVGGQHSALSCK